MKAHRQRSLALRILGCGSLGTLFLGSAMVATSPAAASSSRTSLFSSPPQKAVCKGAEGYQAAGGARTFLWRPEWLAANKAALAADPAARANLIRTADAALRRGPYSVTEKPEAAQSGDKRDYLSIGPYWWPNGKSADGKPYMRRDGQVNPERNGDKFDATRFSRLSRDVETLALAWHMLGERKYADHAAKLIRTWFIDPKTRMNPNLDYAQAVPGVSAGRAEGVIDAARLTPVVEAMGVLGPSGVLSADEHRTVEAWFGELAQWMATSPNGKAERRAKNNHGIFYDMLLGHFALYARLEPVTTKLAEAFPQTRLAAQLAADGSLPAETARTRSWHYSIFTLTAATQMAMLGECVGTDIWGWTGPDGRSLRKAIGFVAAYRDAPTRWPFRDMDLANAERRDGAMENAATLFRMAAWGYGAAELDRASTTAPTPTLLWLSPYPR